MSHSLTVVLDEVIKGQTSRNKKMWNFVKGDVETLLRAAEQEGIIDVTRLPNKGFFVEHLATGNGYTIAYDLAFADYLNLGLNDLPFLSTFLAVIMRLEQTYTEAFHVHCETYTVVGKAVKRLEDILQIKATRSWLSTFICCPQPGRKPQANKPLTGVEVRRNMIQKKRAEGRVSLSTWLTESVKKELDQFCQNQGVTIEEALNKLIPVGINTTCSVLKNFAPALK